MFGATNSSNYTVEADVRATQRRRQMGDVGIIAQRYVLVLFGNSQKLELQPWQADRRVTVRAPFAWKPDTWYRLKLRVENLPDGTRACRARLAGRRARARRVDCSRSSTDRHRQGAPGLYSDAGSESSSTTSRSTRTSEECSCLALIARLPRSSLTVAAVSPRGVRRAPPSGDWPMWGGTPDRNMVSNMKGLPTTWDVKTKKNVKWVAALGSQTYGNPVVAGGMVFVGTNNEGAARSEAAGDRGVLMAFRESDGEFLWQIAHEKLAPAA